MVGNQADELLSPISGQGLAYRNSVALEVDMVAGLI